MENNFILVLNQADRILFLTAFVKKILQWKEEEIISENAACFLS